jgi:hypothetical protein
MDRTPRKKRQDSEDDDGSGGEKVKGKGKGKGKGRQEGKGKGKAKGQDEAVPPVQDVATDNAAQPTPDATLEAPPATVVVDTPPAVETIAAELTSDVPLVVETTADTVQSESVLALPTEGVETVLPIALAPEDPLSSSSTLTTQTAAAVDATSTAAVVPAAAQGGLSEISPSQTTSVAAPTPLVGTTTTGSPIFTSSAPARAEESDTNVDTNAPGVVSADPGFIIGTAGESVPEGSAYSDPFPNFGGDNKATAGYGGLRPGEKGGIAVGSVGKTSPFPNKECEKAKNAYWTSYANRTLDQLASLSS